MQRARERGYLAAAGAAKPDVVRGQRLERAEVPVARGGEEAARELVALRARGLEARPPLLHVAARPGGELARVVFRLADDPRDLVVAVVEHVVEEQYGALLGRQALEQHEEGKRERVRHLGLRAGVVGHDWLGQPLAHVALAPCTRRAELVDRESRRDRGDVGARGLDLLAALEGAMQAQQRLLHDVLGLAHAAEHAVRDPERDRSELAEQVVFGGQAATASAKPSRQLECAGCQPSSRFAFSFDAPRTSVIMTAAASPASARPSQRGTCLGGLAPATAAAAGSHSATGAGSSSTML